MSDRRLSKSVIGKRNNGTILLSHLEAGTFSQTLRSENGVYIDLVHSQNEPYIKRKLFSF
jgi:hypothetical protein